MGWFWTDSPAQQQHPSAPHPLPKTGANPPPGCPMHAQDQVPLTFPPRHENPSQVASSCPVKSPNHPMNFSGPSSPRESDDDTSGAKRSKYNPLNFMFSSLSNKPSDNQSISLGRDREISSIPRGDADSNWEYPSPQQMYNAMLRKGYTDTPIDAVTSMVEVHNFLNEGAWIEIKEWEYIFGKGLREGWEKCKRGEQNMQLAKARARYRGEVEENPPKLLRFQGRPKDLTPKATMLQVMGWIYPQKFSTEPPFDRHDWYVQRSTPQGPKEVRYVIDYYSGDPEPTGEPVFFLDIRPAIDSPSAAAERMIRWGGDVWYKASGLAVREAAAERESRRRKS